MRESNEGLGLHDMVSLRSWRRSDEALLKEIALREACMFCHIMAAVMRARPVLQGISFRSDHEGGWFFELLMEKRNLSKPIFERWRAEGHRKKDDNGSVVSITPYQIGTGDGKQEKALRGTVHGIERTLWSIKGNVIRSSLSQAKITSRTSEGVANDLGLPEVAALIEASKFQEAVRRPGKKARSMI